MNTPLLGPAEIRRLADLYSVRPRKSLGQNFLHDQNTIRSIVQRAQLSHSDTVLEVGPGLGSLTRALLNAAEWVYAVEKDPVLAGAVRDTIPAENLSVLTQDALEITELPTPPTAVVANLPYNVAVPITLHALATFPTLTHGLVMVQSEVADRLTASPGSRVYGVPSVKIAWYAHASSAGRIGKHVFWPEPRVSSALVALQGHAPPSIDGHTPDRSAVFRLVDAAFAQRRKTLRASLRDVLGSDAPAVITEAGLDPTLRAENCSVQDFARIAQVWRGRS